MPEVQKRRVLAGHWPPLSEEYWKLNEQKGLKELEVTLCGFHPPLIKVPSSGLTMPGRVIPLLQVASVAAWRFQSIQHTGNFSIQLHDEDPARNDCLHFDACAESTKVLLPDPYALGSKGFEQIRTEFLEKPLPIWQERIPLAFWRGASTGVHALTRERLRKNLRYQLCSLGLEEPGLIDARITAVVQGRDDNATAQIREHLKEKDLLTHRCPPRVCGLLYQLKLMATSIPGVIFETTQWQLHS